MDREKLTSRLKELEAEHTKTQYMVLALDGAIQDCKYWLAQLDKPEEETNDKNNSE